MSLIDIFNNDKSVFAATPVETYAQVITDMASSGVNDLVAMDMIDPTFRPPLKQGTYIEELFKEGIKI